MIHVSAVIPTLNEAEHVEAAIDSLLAAGADEIIVSDGGSADETVALARRRNCAVLSSPRGRAVQQNLGAAAAKGDALLFLHADCRLAEGGIDELRAALEGRRAVGGAFRHVIEARGLAFRLIERGDAFRSRLFRMPYGDQGIFVRRDAFDAVGGFPEAALMEDVLLMRKLRRRGRIALLNGPVFTSARRWQRRGVVRQTALNWSILAAERIGVPPSKLARWYNRRRDEG